MSEADARLNVLIIGAGIAGLSAGVMLREFADVTILEAAPEMKEVGAAVTMGPGVVAILRRYGIHLEQQGGVVTEELCIWQSDGALLAQHAFHAKKRAGEEIICIHRADLQAALLSVATSTDGPGVPCKLLLDHRFASVDADAGTATLASGAVLTADVLLAADGIRSPARRFILPDAPEPQPTGEAAYRMLLARADLAALGHGLLRAGAVPPAIQMVKVLPGAGPVRKWIAYPARGGALLNFVAYLPEEELNEPVTQRWTSTGSIPALRAAHAHFAPFWTDILAAGKDVGVWQMRDAAPYRTWVRGRAMLLGDAAHAMLPHQAAGAMSAIEDAEALAFALRSVPPAGVHAALQRAFRLRYRRASDCQAASRAEGLFAPPNPHGGAQMFERWCYPGAERWEAERPDMILSEDSA